MPERRIIVQIATSADGFIARGDGSFDWLDRPEPPGGYGMAEFFASIDTILWGRKTYEQAQSMGGTAPFGRKKHYVFSRSAPAAAPADAEFVSEPIDAFARRLRATPGQDIWMMGGAGIIGSFVDAGEIDEFMIHVMPVMIGEGIPLMAPGRRTLEMSLISTCAFTDGVVLHHYAVRREPARGE